MTHTVPIVFVIVPDPVGAGFVASLARPGGNATGFLSFEYSIGAKWLELLKEIMPGMARVAVIRDPAISAGLGQFAAIQAVAPPLGVAGQHLEQLAGFHDPQLDHLDGATSSTSSLREFARLADLGSTSLVGSGHGLRQTYRPRNGEVGQGRPGPQHQGGVRPIRSRVDIQSSRCAKSDWLQAVSVLLVVPIGGHSSPAFCIKEVMP